MDFYRLLNLAVLTSFLVCVAGRPASKKDSPKTGRQQKKSSGGHRQLDRKSHLCKDIMSAYRKNRKALRKLSNFKVAQVNNTEMLTTQVKIKEEKDILDLVYGHFKQYGADNLDVRKETKSYKSLISFYEGTVDSLRFKLDEILTDFDHSSDEATKKKNNKNESTTTEYGLRTIFEETHSAVTRLKPVLRQLNKRCRREKRRQPRKS